MQKRSRYVVPLFLLIAVTTGALRAQDFTGTWQGTLGTGKRALRTILEVGQEDSGPPRVAVLSIDQGGFDDAIAAEKVTLNGSVLKATFDRFGATYEGTLSADGSSITGTLSQRGTSPLNFRRPTKQTAWLDPSPHTVRVISVKKNVKLEVLDWGGSGRAVVLLAGLGNSAHVFDEFAPKLATKYHVYGITRRGFGFSSVPKSGYLADSLADDVLTVLDSLGLKRPVLAGHSIAGEELSSIGSRYPERVAGLVYLDAGYQYAYYDSTQAHPLLSIAVAARQLARLSDLSAPMSPESIRDVIQELLTTSLPELEKDLSRWAPELAAEPNQSVVPQPPPPNPVGQAIVEGEEKYTQIHDPVLALYSGKASVPPGIVGDATAVAKADSAYVLANTPQIDAFIRGVPSARVVVLHNADHYVFKSDEADVLREMRAFIDGLPASTQTAP